MNRKLRPTMDMAGKYAKASAACFGFSLFLRMVYYFGFVNLGDTGAAELIFSLILPGLLCIGWVVLMGCVKFNAPGLYGILTATVCAAMVILNLFSADFLRILLSVLLYGGAGAILILVCAGIMQTRVLSACIFILALVLRLVLYSLGTRGIGPWCLEGSALLLILGMYFFPLALQFEKK